MKIDLVLGRAGKDCHVTLDGHDITHKTRGVKVECGVDRLTTVTLELIPDAVTVDGVDLEILFT
jgi:hypothetical protein